MDDYKKLFVSLRYYLLGREFYMAADALQFAAQYHTGTRKDGKTPEFQHQLEATHYLRTLLPSFMFQEETVAAMILHDVPEDYGVPHADISNRFGSLVGQAVYLMDKNGKTQGAMLKSIGENPIASLCKGADRCHNMQTMVGVFTLEKRLKYMAEAREQFLPMLKSARRLFPKQEAAYENIKHVMTSQLELLEVINNADQHQRQAASDRSEPAGSVSKSS